MTIDAIDVRDLVGHPGASREVGVRGVLEGLAGELAEVPDEIEGELLLESVVEGILVSGHLRGTFRLRCARCLKDFSQPFDVEVHEMFVPAPDEDADDYPLDPEGSIELEQMVRDAIGVEIPFSPLHSPDCQGLCPVCGGDRNLGECPGDHPSTDPRWAGLEQLLEQMER
ncbi:MAG: YceD family protein [Actinomycetota bacterium]